MDLPDVLVFLKQEEDLLSLPTATAVFWHFPSAKILYEIHFAAKKKSLEEQWAAPAMERHQTTRQLHREILSGLRQGFGGRAALCGKSIGLGVSSG